MSTATAHKNHTNGKHAREDQVKYSVAERTDRALTESDESDILRAAKNLIVERPGTCLLLGVVVGGVLGWLTSKLR